MSTDPSCGPRLMNKICLITGASSGIGRAISVLFYQHGAKLALLDIAPFTETLSLIQKSCKSIYSSYHFSL